MIEAKQVTKRFGSFTAIEKLSLHVEQSSIYGLVGYNGAGKTTLLKTLAGIYKPDAGGVCVNGASVFENEAVKRTIFFMPDVLYFLPYSTMEGMAKFYRNFYPLFCADTFEKLTEIFGISSRKRLHGFSKGMQRQAELILALSCHPDVLLLDESFDGLDPAKRNLAKRLLLEYMAEREVSIVISSHNLHEVADLCDRIGLINGKRLVIDDDADELRRSRCRVRMVFGETKGEADFSEIPHSGWNQEDKVITLAIDRDIDASLEKLRQMRPVLFDVIPLTLEEIFLQEMEGEQHDIRSIFRKA